MRLEKIAGAFSEKGICDLGQETKCKIVRCVSKTIQSVISLMAKQALLSCTECLFLAWQGGNYVNSDL